MIKKISILSLMLLIALALTTFGQEKTIVKSNYAKKKLLGRHFLSLQWLDRKYLGRAYVKQRQGTYYLKGKQKNKNDNDFLEIDGVVTEINRFNFKFKGKITTQVSYINNGEACIREGEMTFAITKRRKYWRLREMNNPCGNVTDYVDIYFRR